MSWAQIKLEQKNFRGPGTFCLLLPTSKTRVKQLKQ